MCPMLFIYIPRYVDFDIYHYYVGKCRNVYDIFLNKIYLPWVLEIINIYSDKHLYIADYAFLNFGMMTL